jgi:hypothetical protein
MEKRPGYTYFSENTIDENTNHYRVSCLLRDFFRPRAVPKKMSVEERKIVIGMARGCRLSPFGKKSLVFIMKMKKLSSRKKRFSKFVEEFYEALEYNWMVKEQMDR